MTCKYVIKIDRSPWSANVKIFTHALLWRKLDFLIDIKIYSVENVKNG
jgi:hypothetical protein